MEEQGKSMVELMTMLGVIAIMMAMSGQSLIAAMAKQQANAATTELASELRAARYLAIVRREPIKVFFQPGTAYIRAESVASPGVTVREYDFQKKGVTVEQLSNGSTVVFYPSGRAASATTITLQNAKHERWQLTVSLLGRVSKI